MPCGTIGVATAEPTAARRITIAPITGADGVIRNPIETTACAVVTFGSKLHVAIAAQCLLARERDADLIIRTNEASGTVGLDLAALHAKVLDRAPGIHPQTNKPFLAPAVGVVATTQGRAWMTKPKAPFRDTGPTDRIANGRPLAMGILDTLDTA